MSDEFRLAKSTREERNQILAGARARAREALPCANCGSSADPLVRKPRPLSLAWWDDANCYMGCADCGRFLADLPIAYPFVWESEVPADLEDDPNGSPVNPRDLD